MSPKITNLNNYNEIYNTDKDEFIYPDKFDKDESEVSRLRHGEIKISDCSKDLQEVWDLCLRAKEITAGSFDPC